MNRKLKAGALRYLRQRYTTAGVEAAGKLMALAIETGGGDAKLAEAKINKELLHERKILLWLQEQVENLKD